MAKASSRRPRKALRSDIRRKNVNIDQAKLDRMRDLLGAESETEAIDQALAMMLFREELLEGVEKIAGTGGITNASEDDRDL